MRLDAIKLNQAGFGTSMINSEMTEHEQRGMTAGEIEMSKLMFKDSIDYGRVRIHKGGLSGLPDLSGNAMTPRGEIYFPISSYKLDFSMENTNTKAWFIHEMTHVWQFQLGYPVVESAAVLAMAGGYIAIDKKMAPAYQYNPGAKKDRKQLYQFNMEQQGEVISDYFRVIFLKDDSIEVDAEAGGSILSEFFREPKNQLLLPSTRLVRP